MKKLTPDQLNRLKEHQEMNEQFEKKHHIAEKSDKDIGSEIIEVINIGTKYEDALLELGLTTTTLTARILEDIYWYIIKGKEK